jgi:hypothetical protein
VFFSKRCPIIEALDNIVLELFTATSTNYWRPEAWKALLWNLHVGIRLFFKTGNPGRVINAMHQLRNMADPNMANVPQELLKVAPPRVPIVSPPGSDGSASGSSTGGGTKKEAKEPKKKPKEPEEKQPKADRKRKPEGLPDEVQFAHHFADDISRVSDFTKEQVTIAQIAPTQAAKINILGDLAKLGANNRAPCLGHLILGYCPRGPRCGFSHSFEKDPTTGQLNGVKTRVKTHCDKFLKDQGKE